MMKNTTKREMTEGEELIKEFLEEEAIDFEQEKEIHGLKEDSKPFRKADFYLTKYKVYVEFFGQWNKEEHKRRYSEKMRVYEINNIPCVYIYPDNLGILGFLFKRRLKKVLKKYNLKWQLFKLNWEIFGEKFGLIGVAIPFLIYYISNFYWKVILSIVLLLHIYYSLRDSFLKN